MGKPTKSQISKFEEIHGEEFADRFSTDVTYAIQLLHSVDDDIKCTILGKAIYRLLRSSEHLHIIRIVDEENGLETYTSSSCWDDIWEHHTSPDLIESVMACYGGFPGKRCRNCGETKRLTQFSHRKKEASKDGRNIYCKQCERDRVKADAERKRNKKNKQQEEEKTEPVKTKKCLECNKWKPQKYFYKDRREQDGLLRICKACHSRRVNR